MIEVEIKNESCKKTEVTLANIEIVKDAVKEFAYKSFKGSYLFFDIYGEIDRDFRVLGAIGEGDENNIRKIDLKKYEKSSLGATNISQDIEGVEFCTYFKLDQSEILKQILYCMSYERFEGGYYAKGKFIGKNRGDLIFIGICGDIKNCAEIKSVDLDEIIKSMPKLSESNNFYINEFMRSTKRIDEVNSIGNRLNLKRRYYEI
ncbi:hypothetical protein [uncultured Campylobacter sp.]|uniref:hypothetical protein n=1 Tax=uncultured Campylobacter sp. TaxID=218934 RepID=UPI002609ACE9|nr:hypothetical protein [uncultured Campylobacter sp.]